MPSVAQRQKRQTQRQSPYVLTLASWSTVAPNAPDFGPVNPPAEAIAAGQTERVVKDVVKCGQYSLGYDASGKERVWNITPQVLAQFVTNFKQMKANGQRPNLGKTHGDLETLLIHPDDLMAPIDDLKVVGDTLWMSAYVTPEDVKYLQNPARKVSIGALPNYADSQNRRYPGDSMLHVAVTDRPAVNGQGAFVAMADASPGGGSMNPDIVKAFNELFGLLGQGPMADVTDEEQLLLLVNDRIKSLGGTTEEAPAEGAEPAAEGMDAMAATPTDGGAAPPAFMAQKLKAQGDQIKVLTDRLAAADKEKADAIRTNFHAACDNAMKIPVNGRIAAKADVDKAKALADRIKNYDPDIVALIPRTLSTQSVARTLADPNPSGGSTIDDERKAIAKDIARRRGITEEAAMKLVP